MHDELLLDSPIYKDRETIQSIFDKMADILLNRTILKIGSKDCILTEIECYIFNANHPDLYTHRDDDQKKALHWYFHKAAGKSYRGGTYKGMDITFGFKDQKTPIYGGVLIRAIRLGEEEVAGPSKVVDKILSIFKKKSISSLVKYLKTLDINKSALKLVLTDVNRNQPIYQSPRVGLSFKYPKYAVKNYRYLTNIDSVEKYKPSVIVELYLKGMAIKNIATVTKTNEALVLKYIDLYKAGQKLDNIDGLKPSNKNIVLLSGYMSKQREH
ncbi:MAG: hypothetical protein Hyperionvirus3_147 [Hyperionvirus sp.]|uniref:Uncharacterized protein n=1 Tax=Hyperionvirus sp. TaxID=2487770 RepID=A0A3G5A9Y1_9VIRU|nr:MAG: hypothetical protein Hyperionvirus3_147 [Hyperionvirus sp.]